MKELLTQSRLFSGLNEDDLAEIAQIAQSRTARAGEVLFFDGDPAEALFVVGTGKVKVFKLSPDGREQILLIAREGETFAEAAMFAGGKYPASAQALESSELVVIPRGPFTQLIKNKPQLALSLIARLATLLRHLASLVEGLSLNDVTTRLARYLLSQIEDPDSDQPVEIVLADQKAVLASHLGTIPETFSRSLARLVKADVLKVDGRQLTIKNIPELRRIAAGDV